MREIKFRAWATADSKMYYDAWFDNLEVHWFDTENDEWTVIGDVHENTMLHQAVLMQFTGLRDKNSKEIYEGDIVYFETCPRDDPAYGAYGDKHIILFHSGSFGWEEDGDFYDLRLIYSVIEIIGNLYETPELLK